MYLKNVLVSLLKIKNIILLVCGILLIGIGGYILLSLWITYINDWNTFVHAKATPPSVRFMIIGLALIVCAVFSRRAIYNAEFYSGYFEGDLDGYITYDELAAVTGKSVAGVKAELLFLRPIYMKKVRSCIRNNTQMLELYSKRALCQCRNCGAQIEKRIYFTGVCPYCHGSDIFARVLTDNRVYSISNSVDQGVSHPDFYTGKGIRGRLGGHTAGLCVSLVIMLINLFMTMDLFSKYNDQNYLKKQLLAGKLRINSIELEKADLMNTIIFALVIAVLMIPPMVIAISHLRDAINAIHCSRHFAKCPSPTVRLETVPIGLFTDNPKRKLKSIRRAIRAGYLKNCSIEKHGGTLQIMLAKRVVKDACPNCGAPIVGAVNENYQCPYCRKKLMGVLVKW